MEVCAREGDPYTQQTTNNDAKDMVIIITAAACRLLHAPAQCCAPRLQCGPSNATLQRNGGLPGMLGSRPWGFVTQVSAELIEGQLTMAPLCKDSISPGPGRGQGDGQGDLCRRQGPLWVQPWSPWRHQWWLLSVLSLPSPTLQVLGTRSQGRDGSRLAESSTEPVGLGTVLSRSAVCAAFGKLVLIPFHLLSMAVSCLQEQRGRFLKWELLCGSSPHTCSSIHQAVLDPFVGWPAPLPVASPPSQLPHLLCYFRLQQARPGMHQPSPLGGREEGRRGGAGARDGEGIN